MKKIGKFLTLLLALSMLISVFIVSTSAAETVLVPPGAQVSYDQDGADMTDPTAIYNLSGSTSTSTPTNKPAAKHFKLTSGSEEGNAFMQFYEQQYNYDTKPYIDFMFDNSGFSYNAKTDSYNLVNLSMATFDFDLAADAYLTTDKDGKQVLSSEKGENGILSHSAGSYLSFIYRYYRADQKLTQAQDSDVRIYFINQDGVWYCAKNEAGEEKFEISQNVKEWNHFSFVIDIDSSVKETDADGNPTAYNFYNSKMHLYYNGEYKFSFNNIFDVGKKIDQVSTYKDGKVDIKFDVCRWWFPESKGTLSTSFRIDNISMNYYMKDYQGPLDEHMQDGNYTKPIYNCTDVVFNKNYTFQLPNSHVAEVEDQLGNKTGYFVMGGATSALRDGYTLYLYKDLENFEPNCGFNVESNGYSFSIKSAEYTYDKVGDRYVVRLADGTEYCDVYWYIDEGAIPGETEAQQYGTYVKNADLIYTGNLFFPSEDPSVYKSIVGWQCDYDLDGVMDGEVTKLTDEVLTQVQSNYGILVLYPIYEYTTLSYGIYDQGTGELLMPDMVEKYFDTSTLAEMLGYAMTPGADIYVKLYSDARVSNSIYMPSGNAGDLTVLRFDINGHTLTRDGMTNSGFIYTADYSELYVFSSAPGGQIFNCTLSGTTLYGGGFITQNRTVGINDTNIYLGAYDDGSVTADGGNLAIYTGVLIDLIGCHNVDEERRNVAANVVIDGGYYVRSVVTTYALLCMRDFVNLTIKDATLVAHPENTGGCALITDDERYVGPLNATIENSTLIAVNMNGEVSNMFNYLGSNDPDGTIEINNSLIIGNLNGKISDGYKIILGDGTRIASDTYHSAVSAKEGSSIVSSGESIEFSFNYNRFAYSAGSMTEDSKNILTNTNNYTIYFMVSGAQDFATINWCNPDGSIVKTTYATVGTTIIPYDGADVEPMDTGNGWFSLGFLKWDSEDFYIGEAGVYTYTAVLGKPVANVSGIKIGLTMFSRWEVNAYVPTDTPENVEYIGMFNDAACTKPFGAWQYNDVVIDGRPYQSGLAYQDVDKIYQVRSFYVQYKINYEGTEVYTVQKVQFSVLDYFEAVLNSAEFADDGIEKKLIMNVANYANECMKLAGTSDSRLTAILEGEYKGLIVSDPVIDEAELDVDYSALGEYIGSVTFKVGGDMAWLAISPKDLGNKNLSYMFSIDTLESGVVESEFNLDREWEYEGNTYIITTSEHLKVFDLTEVITITVYNELDEAVASGTYSLAAYITAIENDGASDSSGLAAAKALYSYAKLVEEFKLTK